MAFSPLRGLLVSFIARLEESALCLLSHEASL
jgi:hypothetical protein